MDLEITGRGTQVTAKLRAQAEAGLNRIQRVIGPKCNAKIVLTCEKNHCMVEVTIHSALHDFSARCEAPKEVEAALKDALEKVEAQAVKSKKKMVTLSHHPEQDSTGSVRRLTEDEIRNDPPAANAA